MVSPLNSSSYHVENAAVVANHLSTLNGAQGSSSASEPDHGTSKDIQVDQKVVSPVTSADDALPYVINLEKFTIRMKKGYASSCENYLSDALKKFPGQVYVIHEAHGEKTCYYKNDKGDIDFLIYNHWIDSDLSTQNLYKINAIQRDPNYLKVKLLFSY